MAQNAKIASTERPSLRAMRLLPRTWRMLFSLAAIGLTGCGQGEDTQYASAVTAVTPATAATVREGQAVPAKATQGALANLIAGCRASETHPHCLVYDHAGDHALVKDLRGRTHFLLLSLSAISGIEEPSLLLQTTRPYFHDAWAMRRYVFEAVGQPLPDSRISLAINPMNARTQNHFHIHLACAREDVREALAAAHITDAWSDWTLDSRVWKVRRLPMETFRTDNLFARIARELPDVADTMGTQSIFVTGAPVDRAGLSNDPAVFVATRRIVLPFDSGRTAEHLTDIDCGVRSHLPDRPLPVT
jgi:CDP-diacylglycerol pyrophosphatase